MPSLQERRPSRWAKEKKGELGLEREETSSVSSVDGGQELQLQVLREDAYERREVEGWMDGGRKGEGRAREGGRSGVNVAR